ncbi:class I SAM-dependent methyltransferase [Bacillus massiliigorillae]|uniref:class I SAM-dependent methyltransferase n=1 Tax=Bacillus massiliigorillae TaxID=1243664 RepID=UPI0005A6F1A6|nr:class I SAM-dependent methyltransferase [Bacillus massiliigorillae]
MSWMNKLIEQAKKPNGTIGSIMIRIMNFAHAGMNKWAMKKMKINRESVLLDIGCGGGKAIQLLSQTNTYEKIYGIDYSEQAVVDSIRLNIQEVQKGKVEILQASVTNLPFIDQTFDLISAFQTHYFWSDLENAVKEISRVLKQDGEFFLVAEKYKINYHMKVYKTKAEMEQLLKNVGFRTVEFFENNNAKWLCVKGSK